MTPLMFRACVGIFVAMVAFEGAVADDLPQVLIIRPGFSTRLFLGVLADSNPKIAAESEDVAARFNETLDIDYWHNVKSGSWGASIHQSLTAPESSFPRSSFVLAPSIWASTSGEPVEVGAILGESQINISQTVSDSVRAEFRISSMPSGKCRNAHPWVMRVVGRLAWEQYWDHEEGFENTPSDLTGAYFSPKIEMRWNPASEAQLHKLFTRSWHATNVTVGLQRRWDRPHETEFDFQGWGAYVDAAIPLDAAGRNYAQRIMLRTSGEYTWGDYLRPSQFDPAADRADHAARLMASLSVPTTPRGEIVVGVAYGSEHSAIDEYDFRQLSGTIGWRFVWPYEHGQTGKRGDEPGSVVIISDSGPTKPRVQPPPESRLLRFRRSL